jgi:hypothetical protein
VVTAQADRIASSLGRARDAAFEGIASAGDTAAGYAAAARRRVLENAPSEQPVEVASAERTEEPAAPAPKPRRPRSGRSRPRSCRPSPRRRP